MWTKEIILKVLKKAFDKYGAENITLAGNKLIELKNSNEEFDEETAWLKVDEYIKNVEEGRRLRKNTLKVTDE